MSPEAAFDVVAAEQLAVAGVTRRMMFGRDTLLAEGHPFAFQEGDRIALKLGEAPEMVAAGEGSAAVMGRRVMRQWVAVPLDGCRELVDAARDFVLH